MVELNEILEQLALIDERYRQVVELKFFGCMTWEEVGQVMDGLSPRQAQRLWDVAAAWLKGKLTVR